MDAGPALCDVLRDRRVVCGRLEQLDRGVADRDEMRAHALRHDVLGRFHLETEGVVKKRERLPDVVDGDADVIEDGGSASVGSTLGGIRPTYTCGLGGIRPTYVCDL